MNLDGKPADQGKALSMETKQLADDAFDLFLRRMRQREGYDGPCVTVIKRDGTESTFARSVFDEFTAGEITVSAYDEPQEVVRVLKAGTWRTAYQRDANGHTEKFASAQPIDMKGAVA